MPFRTGRLAIQGLVVYGTLLYSLAFAKFCVLVLFACEQAYKFYNENNAALVSVLQIN